MPSGQPTRRWTRIPSAEITSAVSGQRRRIAIGPQIRSAVTTRRAEASLYLVVVADVLTERGRDADDGEQHGEDAVDGERVERPQPFDVTVAPAHRSNVPNCALLRIGPANDMRVRLETYVPRRPWAASDDD